MDSYLFNLFNMLVSKLEYELNHLKEKIRIFETNDFKVYKIVSQYTNNNLFK